MSTSRIPNKDRSHALIIGASEYGGESGYAPVPTAKSSARRLAELIRTPQMWDLEKESVKLLVGPVTTRQVGDAIEQAAQRQDIDGLFVYICAHGRVFGDNHVPDKKLHFAFADSREAWSYTHLPFLTVRRMLTMRPNAAATVLVIDSCYAADAYLGTDPDPVPDVPGVCTLIATKHHERAHASGPGSPYPAYSGALIDIIERGIRGPDAFLTPQAVSKELRRRMAQGGHPEPGMRADETSLFLCRNKACIAVENAPPQEELRAMLNDTATVDFPVYAAALAAVSQGGHHAGGDAARLVTEFGEKRSIAEIVGLSETLRARGAAELSEYADLLLGRVYKCRPAADILTLLHRHDAGGTDIDALLALLREQQQPEQVLADVSAGLRKAEHAECPNCAELKRRLDARMLSAWPKDRRLRLLAALY
jgi:hypothetical protein